MKGQYYRIDWDTCDRLHLYGREAMVYCALIYLCKNSPYTGSATDLADFSHCGTKRTTLRMLSSLEEKGLIVRKEHSIILGQIDPPSGQTVAPSGQNVPISKEKSTKKENIIKENKGGGDIAPPPPNYSEVLSFGKEKNIPESVCLGFFSHFTEFHWKHKDGDVVDNWKATLTSWYLREKKSVAKSIYQNVYGQASEQEQAAYAGSQYASYAARKAEEKQADQLRQQNTETRYVSYDDYKKA